MPLLINLSKVDDVRDVLGCTHANHELDLPKAEQLADQLVRQKQAREKQAKLSS